MKIAIDFGHGCGSDRGAEGILNEEKVIREYGPLVIAGLKALGHTVYNVTPSGNLSIGDSLAARVNAANNLKPDVFVSLHVNCYNGQGHGCEVEYISNGGLMYANRICTELAKLGFTNRGPQKRTGLYVLKYTDPVAILIEPFFCDNQSDCCTYSRNPQAIANAIIKGITGQDTPISIIPKKEDLKVKNLIVYCEGADKRAAEYLADGLKCPIICRDNLTQDIIDACTNIYMVGGSAKPCDKAILISGADRFATVKAVLAKLGL